MSTREFLRLLRWVKYELKAWAGLSEVGFSLYNLIFGSAISRRFFRSVRTRDLVMEGFGGSANSFAWYAFRSANPNIHISHHLHVPVNVIKAVKSNVPVILIVRDPVGSVVSLYSRGYIPFLAQGFRHYAMFHRRLLSIMNKVQIATFEQVTADMGRVIERCNCRFGTEFMPFEHTPEQVQAVRSRIPKSSQVTSARSAIKEKVMRQIENDPCIRKLCGTAEELYRQFISAGE